MITQETLGFPGNATFEQVELVEKGLPLDSLDSLKEKGLTSTEIFDLVIPARTLKHRKARGQNLSSEETERLMRVSRMLTFAESVFRNRDKSLRWLRKTDDRIGNRTRLSLTSGETASGVIRNMLGQIAEGMFT